MLKTEIAIYWLLFRFDIQGHYLFTLRYDTAIPESKFDILCHLQIPWQWQWNRSTKRWNTTNEKGDKIHKHDVFRNRIKWVYLFLFCLHISKTSFCQPRNWRRLRSPGTLLAAHQGKEHAERGMKMGLLRDGVKRFQSRNTFNITALG